MGRLELNKRVELIIRALALTDRSVRLVIAGDGSARSGLEHLAVEARCRRSHHVHRNRRRPAARRPVCGRPGGVYPPLDEDYGYVTLEAFLARKPVVTTADAGGPLEFVVDGVNGIVADAAPDAIAAAIAAWPRTGRWRGGWERRASSGRATITWDGVVDRLVG